MCVHVMDKVYTVYAVVVYLDDKYIGGTTQFMKSLWKENDKEEQRNEKGKLVASKCGGYKCLNFRGKVGDALIFRKEILHKGGKVDDGIKHVLRFDMAYKIEEHFS